MELKNINSYFFRLFCWIIVFTFSVNTIGEDFANAWSVGEPQNIIMPAPGTLMHVSPIFSLPTLKAISIDPKDPFKIDFVMDGAGQRLSEESGQQQVNLLIRYFLSFLTIPEEDLWVNLSPSDWVERI